MYHRFSVFRNQFFYMRTFKMISIKKKLEMTVKENTIYFILQLPQMKTTFVHKSQKVNLQGNIYTHPTLPFYFLFTFYLHMYIFLMI